MDVGITNTESYIKKQEEKPNSKPYKFKIFWYHVYYFIIFHLVAFYGIYLCFTSTSWKTILFAFVLERITTSLGIMGIHRLWAHRCFKAKLPLRIFLCIVAWALGQGYIFTWSRDHRVHHKYVDTDADPYNIKRGIFYAHIGWLMLRKQPEVIAAGRKLPLDDLLADPVVIYNRKYYYPMWILLCFILPTIIPVYYWNENWLDAFCVAGVLKYLIQIHSVFCINSVAHAFGYRPYDKKMEARESFFSEVFQPGEGSHNYHHAFPTDYTTKEIAMTFNFPRFFIEFMALIGQAYDLKMSSDELVQAKKLKNGYGSR